MTTVRRQVDVAAPAAAVFDMVVDPEVAVRHVPNILAVRDRTSGPVALGSQWIQTMWVAGQQVEVSVRVVEFERPDRCTIELSGPPGMRARITLWVTARGQGATVEQIFDYTQPGGALGALAGRLVMDPMVKREIDENLTILKRVAEAELGPKPGTA